jgi:hypothetical protein
MKCTKIGAFLSFTLSLLLKMINSFIGRFLKSMLLYNFQFHQNTIYYNEKNIYKQLYTCLLCLLH